MSDGAVLIELCFLITAKQICAQGSVDGQASTPLFHDREQGLHTASLVEWFKKKTSVYHHCTKQERGLIARYTVRLRPRCECLESSASAKAVESSLDEG